MYSSVLEPGIAGGELGVSKIDNDCNHQYWYQYQYPYQYQY